MFSLSREREYPNHNLEDSACYIGNGVCSCDGADYNIEECGLTVATALIESIKSESLT
jgi:hypothetical protein